MTRQRLYNATLAIALAALMCLAHLLDGPDDIQAEQAQALSLQDAQASAVATAKQGGAHD